MFVPQGDWNRIKGSRSSVAMDEAWRAMKELGK